jgi:anti-sigma factor RsiW
VEKRRKIKKLCSEIGFKQRERIMSEIEFEKLREASWRRKLTTQEEAALNRYLATHAEARTQWEEESGLNELFGKLPTAPISTNFTARVLQEVQRDAERNSQRKHGIFHWIRFNWLPRIAFASLLLCGGIVSVHQIRVAQRTQIARDIATVSSAATVPQQWLEDFEAIDHLSQPPIDNELLAALE